MTRLPGRVGAGRAQHSSTRTKFRKHKVIMESVTQKRKKLRSIISFEPNAPPGYTFIPAGNPQFTIACKELCREQGLKVFTVTTTPHQNTHGLSQQVHRVGYHFPSTVVAKRCMELGLYLSENGNAMPFENFGTKFTRTEGEVEVSQVTINTEARDVIRDLFPNIPDEDINQIIKTAFQKGQRKVGTAVELPLARRAQLAVVAHIRHVYTDYDKLLKKTSFQEARRQVEDNTLERLVQWRGDDESGMPELEDVFREVIVISDDEEEEEEDSDIVHNKRSDRDLSVEIVSTQVVSDKLDINANDDGNHFVNSFPVKVSGEPSSHQYNFMTGTRSQTFSKSKVDRRGFSRYQAWDRAMNRYREKKLHRYEKEGLPENSTVSRNEAVILSRPLHSHVTQASRRPLTPIIERIFDPPLKSATYDIRPHSSDRFHHTSAHGLQDDNRIQSTLPGSKAPDILHFPDGSVFGKIPPATSNKRSSRPVDITSAPVFVAGPRLSEGPNDNGLKKRVYSNTHRTASNNQVDGSPRSNTIVPSIEHRESPLPTRFSAGYRITDSNLMSESTPGASAAQSRRPLDELSKGIDLIDLTEDTTEFPKRRRLESREFSHDFHRSAPYTDDVSYLQTGKPASPRAPAVMHNRYSDSIPDGGRLNRLPIRRKDLVPYIMDGSREETNHALYHSKDMLRDTAGTVSAKPRVPLHPPEIHNETGFSSTGRPRIDRLPQYRDPSFKADGYESDAPRVALIREDRPATSHHSRGPGSDDAVWRNKANSYRSQRRLLEAQDPSWSMSEPKPSFYGSRAQRPERATHSPALTQEDIMDPSPNFIIDARPEYAPQRYDIQNRRVSSQPPLLDTQRKRDTLPVSAMRRYEVQLEKSMNPRRYEPAPHQER